MPHKEANTPTPTTEPGVQSKNDGSKSEWLQTRLGERCLIRISAAETGGAYAVTEIVSDSGDGTSLHIHQNEDEHFIILEGTIRIVYGDKTFDVAAGASVTLEKGIPHAWRNPSKSRLRMVVMTSPGGCEEILRVVARGDDIEVATLAERFDIRTLGPMPSS